jgi:CheY-like chemotaxis protein
MTNTTISLAGLRILVVEDEGLIAMDIEDMLLDLTCVPVGPASTIETALDIIRGGTQLDGVLLDMNLHGQSVQPIVAELVNRNIFFILVTGYARREDEVSAMRDAPRLAKPFSAAKLSDILKTTFLDGR